MAEELNNGMPDLLNTGPTYTYRVTTLDANGALVAGTKIGTTVITADQVVPLSSDFTGQETQNVYGDWFLVPGPGA